MGTNLRIGVAGLGAASKQILPHIDRVPGMALTAGADTRPDAVEEFQKKYHGRKAFNSVEEMYASGEIDAVWIATPNVNHADHTVKAAEHGIHVIVEKPTAVTLAETDRMIEACDRNKVKLVQGHSKVYGPAIQKIREIVASGRLGKVIQINSWNSNDWLQRPRLASEVDTSVGGGIVFRQGPHMIDIIRYIGGGMVKSVRAVTGRNDAHFNTEGDYTAFLEFENGCAATGVFNGYGFFDAAELTWGIGEGGKRLPEEATGQHAPGERLKGAVDMEYKYAHPRTTEERATRERSRAILLRHHRGGLRERDHPAIAERAVRLQRERQERNPLWQGRRPRRRAEIPAGRHRRESAALPRRPLGQSDAGSLPRHAAILQGTARDHAVASGPERAGEGKGGGIGNVLHILQRIKVTSWKNFGHRWRKLAA